MLNKIDPLKLELLILGQDKKKQLAEVSVLDVFTPSTQNFHPDGLFSTEIFGTVGTASRNVTFGYISLGVNVLHPLVYNHIVSLGAKYKDIIMGKKYAVWDSETSNFIDGDMTKGRTGFQFFMEHLDEIEFIKNNSLTRTDKIKLIDKYRKSTGIAIDTFLVLPAGLRDFTVDKNGDTNEDEINELYRRILALSTLLKTTQISTNDLELVNPTRVKLQLGVVNVYDYILTLLDGKRKFIQGKWTKRGVVNGTRNVITALPSKIIDLDKIENSIGINQTAVGIYQYATGTRPITKFHLRNEILDHIFNNDSTSAYLINKKTGLRELVEIDELTKERWYSDEGLDSIISKLGQQGVGHDRIEIKGHWLGMIYKDSKYTRVVLDPSSMPANLDKKKLSPMTYGELFYYSLTKIKDKYPAVTSRYPITGEGSIYPTKIYLKTTTEGESRILLGDDYLPTEVHLTETPSVRSAYYGGMSIHYSKLSRLGADFDGDMMGFIFLYTKESVDEIDNLFKQRQFYVDSTGAITHSTSNQIVNDIVKTLNQTKDK